MQVFQSFYLHKEKGKEFTFGDNRFYAANLFTDVDVASFVLKKRPVSRSVLGFICHVESI